MAPAVRPSLRFLLLAVLVAIITTAVDGKTIDCYGHNGKVYGNNTICPGSNACCNSGATCLSNRLCHNPDDGPGTFVRGPCAVKSYDSGTCAPLCLYDEKKGILPRVRLCSDGSLCCDDDSQCCNKKNGRFLDNHGQLADEAPSTTFSWGPERTEAGFRTDRPTSTSSPAKTSPSATDSPSPKDDDDDGKSNNGTKIGLGVGIPVGCLLLAGVAFWFVRRKKRASTSKHHPIENRAEMSDGGHNLNELDATQHKSYHPVSEMEG